MKHQITRVRHETKRRKLVVRDVSRITPAMVRVTLQGPELEGFKSPAPDDHIKLLVPDGQGGTAMRDYTPRLHSPSDGTLAIDFAIHEAGPATRWAMTASPGDAVEIGGPRGSMMVPYSFDWWLLIGDETALPAIARRLEDMPAGTRAISIAAVGGEGERLEFVTKADLRDVWVFRSAERMADPSPLLDALRSIDLPDGDGFIWVAAEAEVARAIRRYVFDTLGHPPAWTRLSGYWRMGEADAHVNLEP